VVPLLSQAACLVAHTDALRTPRPRRAGFFYHPANVRAYPQDGPIGARGMYVGSPERRKPAAGRPTPRGTAYRRRVCWSPRTGVRGFGCGGSFAAAGGPSFASAERSGSRRGVGGKPVLLDGTPDCCGNGGVFAVGQINYLAWPRNFGDL
jgi:hypothetical protein